MSSRREKREGEGEIDKQTLSQTDKKQTNKKPKKVCTIGSQYPCVTGDNNLGMDQPEADGVKMLIFYSHIPPLITHGRG